MRLITGDATEKKKHNANCVIINAELYPTGNSSVI